MNNFNRKLLTGLIASFVFMLIIPVQLFAKTLDIKLHNNRVNIYTENATLSSIANEISVLTGVTIYLDKSLEEKTISVEIRNASFEKGIKMLTYPLNYVIIRNTGGDVKELRIFKNPGGPDKNYRVFSSSKVNDMNQGKEDKNVKIEMSANKPAGRNPAGSSNPQSAIRNPQPAIRNPKSEISSEPVTGEKAFNDNIWANMRMMEYQSIIAQERIKADQMEAVLRNRDIVMKSQSPQPKNTLSPFNYANSISVYTPQPGKPNENASSGSDTAGQSDSRSTPYSSNPLYDNALRYYKGLDVLKTNSELNGPKKPMGR